MDAHADKTQENKSQSVTNEFSQNQSYGESTFQIIDNRPEVIAQRKLQAMANNSPQASQLKALQDTVINSPLEKQTTQFQKMAKNYSDKQQQPIQKKENNTGLPDNLKTRIENLSGYSMDDVKVHYNSDKPAQLQAHAYAQGTDIHLASGQEKHLPHEAWHVVQQKQGKVKPTMQMKGTVNVNNDAGLEHEADVMGAKAKKKLEKPDNKLMNLQDMPNHSMVTQRMRMELFNETVEKELPKLVQEFNEYFNQQYTETEAAGGFLAGGVMYNWDYTKYIQDEAFTKEMLRDEIEYFKSSYKEKQEKNEIFSEPETGLKTTRIGNLEITDEKQADDIFFDMSKAWNQVHKEKTSEAKEIFQKKYSKRFIQVILNSVSNSVRESDWGDLIVVADIYGQNVPLKRLLIETETRIGFEIEPGSHFKVAPKYFDIVDELTNVTLASTEYLEFIIDDLNRKTGVCQVEFRTKPLAKELLSKSGKKVGSEIKRSISTFPIKLFDGKNSEKLFSDSKGWEFSPKINAVFKGLEALEYGRLKAKDVQHVTHSLPISSFIGLSSEYKNLILPGAGKVNDIFEFIDFLFKKIEIQVEENTINITTKGRNSSAPNIKSGLDLIIGMLPPELSRMAMKYFSKRIPAYVQVVEKVAKVSKLTTFVDIEETPSFNPEGTEGSLSGEEKLKPLLFDVMRRDIRILVEHRADNLVKAVNDLWGGKAELIKPYVEAFTALDEVQSKAIFGHWFQ